MRAPEMPGRRYRLRWMTVCALLVAGPAVTLAQVSPDSGLPSPASAPTVVAQSPAQDTEATSRPAQVQVLHERQQSIRDRVQQLEGRMLKLTRLLAESEPDKADRLRDALDQVGQKRVRGRLDRIVALLRDTKYDQAEHEQQSLTSDLESIFTLLTDTLNELDRRREEQERLEAHAKAIKVLIEEQTEQLHRTQFAEGERERAAALGKLAEDLEKMAAQQAQLREKGAGAAPSTGQRSEQRAAQADLEKQARAAAARLGKMESPAADPQTAQAEQAAAEDAGAAADAMQSAAEAMQSAGETSGSPSESTAKAVQEQQKAEEKLRRAVQRLREEEQRLRDQNAFREVERLQRQTQQGAAGRSEQMQKDAQSGKPTPGSQQVGKAAEQMKNAADRLGEEQGDEAQAEQQAAVEQLQEALDELDDALRQLRKEEMEETLTALEQRFRSLLAREESVKELIVALHAIAPDVRTRSQVRQIEETADVQRQVTTDCEATLRILVDEGTTVILPELVKQLATDMAALADRLERTDVSASALVAIDDIIASLKEILEVVEQKREQMQNSEEQGEAAPQDANEPLVPGSAELKLLRASQLRINRRTDELQKSVTGPPAADIQPQFDALAERQRQLAELARRMNERS